MMKKQLFVLSVAATTALTMSCGGGKQQEQGTETSADELTQTTEETVPSADVVKGELGLFELRGPVKECKMVSGDYTVTLSFDENGLWTKENDQPLDDKFPAGIDRDEDGRIVKGHLDPYEDLYIGYAYNEEGLASKIVYAEYMDGGSIETRDYDEQGYATTIAVQYTGMDGIDEETGEELPPVVNTCTIQEKDEHGNWTKRLCGSVSQTRSITYYE